MKNKGAITLASVSCRDAMPDPGFYTECLNESFEVLHDAALSQTTGDKKITCGFIKVTQSGNLSISGYYYDCFGSVGPRLNPSYWVWLIRALEESR